MPLTHSHALFGPRFARHLARLTRLYWTSSDAPKGGLLLGATVALELGTVYGNVLLSDVQRRIFDAFQDKQMAAFTSAIGLFLGVALGFVFVSTYRIYLRQALEIRWRHWLTDHFIKEWITSHAYCQIELHRKATDNPDQRIAEDVREYVLSALGLSLSLLSAIATLVSFAAILWRLSGNWKFRVDGNHIQIPGLMMWVAILFAVIATLVTHRVGRRLAGIQFDRQRYEADFRFKLVRFRENVEPIALANGEGAERRFALERFHYVITNWWQLIRAQRNLGLLTTSIGQANSLIPLLVAAPAFFAGHLTLGSVMQTRIAYGEVSGGLTWFVNAYQEIARWRANIERIVTLAEEIESTRDELDEDRMRARRASHRQHVAPRPRTPRAAGRSRAGPGCQRRAATRRSRGARRSDGIGQAHPAARHRGHLALRQGRHRGAGAHAHLDPVAAAAPTDRDPARGRVLSRAGRRLPGRQDSRGAATGRPGRARESTR